MHLNDLRDSVHLASQVRAFHRAVPVTKTIFEIICAWQSKIIIKFVLKDPQIVAYIDFRKFRC